MKCLNCSSEIADNNVFCPLCGTSIVPNQNNNLEGNNGINQMNFAPVDNINVGNNNATDFNNVSDATNNVMPTSVESVNVNASSVSTPVNETVSDIGVSNNNHAMNNETLVQHSVNMDVNPSYNVGFKEEGNPQIKGKSKMPIVIASILIVAILAFTGFFGFKFLTSPKKVFVGVLDKSSEFLSGFVDTRFYTSDTVSMDFDFKTTNKIIDEDMGPIFNIIKNISLNGKFQIDYKNKKILMNLDSKYSNNDLVNAGLYITDEKLYFDLKDLYDKKISVDVEGINEMFKINEYSNDIFNVLDEVKNVVKDSLKDEYFVKENVKMNVNGAEASVDKTTLLLNYKNLKSLLNDVLNNLKVNDKFLNSFVNISKLEEEITKQDVIDEISDMLEDINSGTDSGESEIRIILYTKGLSKEFVGVAIENDVPYYNFNFSIINDKENIYTVKINNGYEEQEAIIKVDGDVYTLELEEDDTKIEIGLNIKTYDYNFNLTSDDLSMTGSLKTDKDGKKNINMLYTIEGNEIGIDMSYITKYNESVTIPSLTPSVDIESISDEDGMNILNKLQEKQGVKDLMSEIEKLTVNSFPVEDEYDYNYENSYSEMLDNAQKSALQVYAARVLSNATTEFVADKLINTSLNEKYYDIATLLGDDTYFGCVKVSSVGEDYDYSILLYDGDNNLKIEGFADDSYLTQNDVVVEWSYSDNFMNYDYSSNTCSSGSLKQKLDSYSKYSTGVNKLS